MAIFIFILIHFQLNRKQSTRTLRIVATGSVCRTRLKSAPALQARVRTPTVFPVSLNAVCTLLPLISTATLLHYIVDIPFLLPFFIPFPSSPLSFSFSPSHIYIFHFPLLLSSIVISHSRLFFLLFFDSL